MPTRNIFPSPPAEKAGNDLDIFFCIASNQSLIYSVRFEEATWYYYLSARFDDQKACILLKLPSTHRFAATPPMYSRTCFRLPFPSLLFSKLHCHEPLYAIGRGRFLRDMSCQGLLYCAPHPQDNSRKGDDLGIESLRAANEGPTTQRVKTCLRDGGAEQLRVLVDARPHQLVLVETKQNKTR